MNLPVASTSDLGSEKQVRNHLEGVPFYGPEMSNRLAGSTRSSSDPIFTNQESQESSNLMKMLRHRLGMETSGRSSDEGILLGHPNPRPLTGSRTVLSPTIHFQAKSTPFRHQLPSSRFKDSMNPSRSIVFQTASDEGSRTGMKRQEMIKSINIGSIELEKNSFGSIGNKRKAADCVSEPEPSVSLSEGESLNFVNRQMTIFYGGQAHVFDDVNPNKANIIMALAGSNGGSWSTVYSPKPGSDPTNDFFGPKKEQERSDILFGHEFGKTKSDNRVSAATAGGREGGKPLATDAANPVQAAKFGTQEKGKVLEL